MAALIKTITFVKIFAIKHKSLLYLLCITLLTLIVFFYLLPTANEKEAKGSKEACEQEKSKGIDEESIQGNLHHRFLSSRG